MKIEILTYYDSKGNPTSKESFFKEQTKFVNEREKRYQQKLNEIIKMVPEFVGTREKTAIIYQYLTDNLQYDYEALNRIDEKGLIGPISHPFWNKWGLGSHEKYAPLLVNAGTCSGIAAAFRDICQKMNIDCEIINGKTILLNPDKDISLGHSWNVVDIDGEKGHVDITYGIFNRDKGLNRDDFFFLTNEELKEIGPHHSFNEEIVNKSKKR